VTESSTTFPRRVPAGERCPGCGDAGGTCYIEPDGKHTLCADGKRPIATKQAGKNGNGHPVAAPADQSELASFGIDVGMMRSAAEAPIERPRVAIDTDEHRVADEVVEALVADDELFHRGGLLSRVIRDDDRNDGISRPEGAPTIAVAALPWIRERITRHVQLIKIVRTRDGESREPAHPPQWLPQALAARGSWPGLRRLNAISDSPILRPDGSVHQIARYDSCTGVLFNPSTRFPEIPDDIGQDDADAAQSRLMETFCDFRFEADEHRAALLAGLLTPLARHAFSGPSPLFLIDANTRGAGKGLAVQCVAEIVLGRSIPVCGYVHEAVEFGKRITSIAIAGDSMVLLDNLTGNFGNDALDRALNAVRWRDRILGASQMVDLPLLVTWFATGNNVLTGTDTARRIIHVRLDVLDEKPEERSDFRHPNLLVWVRQNRARLLADALTILSAYIRAGSPDQKLKPYGSYEGWSALVRSAVVWCGLPDPCATRTRMIEMADTTSDALGQLIDAIRQYVPGGFTVAEVVNQLYPREYPPLGDAAVAMRTALENLAGGRSGKPPSSRAIGNRLRSFRRRVVDGAYLDIDSEKKNSAGATWRLYDAKNQVSSDSGDSSESFPTTPICENNTKKVYGAGRHSSESPESLSENKAAMARNAFQYIPED
jgi:hypothetical protein